MRTNQSDELSLLKSILCEKSVRFGEFTLVSGQKSDIYIDSKLTTYSPEAMPLIGRAFLQKMAARGWHPEAVGGLTLGADPIAFAIARESLDLGQSISPFVVRKEPKKHGMQRFIEGLEETADRQVVILDDVCTTGGSTVQAIEKALAAGMRVLGAICLVDREMGAKTALQEKFGIPLEAVLTLSNVRAELKLRAG
jgi:orotate phosphoribosyltransferase